MNNNNRIRAIIFDLGNVLIDFDHRIAARRISHFCDKAPDEIFSLFFASDVTTVFEEGKITCSEFFLKVKEALNLKLNYETFVAIWNEIFFLTAKNRAVFSLANTLRQHYKIVLLSNINILHFEYLKKYFPIFDIFDYVFTSFELGAVKPNPLVYHKVFKTLEVLPEEVLYTDDRKELVESAKALGIKSLHFTGIEQLKQDLISSGINIYE